MPQWVIFLVLAIAAWLVLAVVGGLVVGRLLAVVGRRLPHPRRPTA